MPRAWIAALACLIAAGCAKKRDGDAAAEPTQLDREVDMALRWAKMPEPDHRRAALEILEQLAAAPLEPDGQRRLVAALVSRLGREPESTVCSKLLDVLRVADPDGYVDRVMELATGSDPTPARRAALEHLPKAASSSHGARVAALLAQSFVDPTLRSHRGFLISAVEAAPHPDAAPHLVLAIGVGATDWERERAGRVLVAVGGSTEQLASALSQLSEDTDYHDGRAALLEALAGREGFTDGALVVPHLASRHEDVRVAAIHALARIRDPAAAATLLRLWRESRSPSNERRALESLLRDYPGVRWPRGPEVDPAGPQLTR